MTFKDCVISNDKQYTQRGERSEEMSSKAGKIPITFYRCSGNNNLCLPVNHYSFIKLSPNRKLKPMVCSRYCSLHQHILERIMVIETYVNTLISLVWTRWPVMMFAGIDGVACTEGCVAQSSGWNADRQLAVCLRLSAVCSCCDIMLFMLRFALQTQKTCSTTVLEHNFETVALLLGN